MQKQQTLNRNKNCILNYFNLLHNCVLDVDRQPRSLPRGLDFPQKLEYNINITKVAGIYSPDKLIWADRLRRKLHIYF